MSVRVRIPAPLRAITGGAAEVNVEGSSVASALGELETQFPEIRTRLRDPEGELRRFVNLYVNGEDIRSIVRAMKGAGVTSSGLLEISNQLDLFYSTDRALHSLSQGMSIKSKQFNLMGNRN